LRCIVCTCCEVLWRVARVRWATVGPYSIRFGAPRRFIVIRKCKVVEVARIGQ
jgi:hypothetical protein